VGPYDTYVEVEHQLCCAHYPDLRIIPTSARLALVGGVLEQVWSG